MNLIIIPYRNRQKHLDYFIENLAPLLKQHLDNLKIIIVEQSNDKKNFNRGKVLNIGIKEYEDTVKFIFTHDVDIIPNEEVIIKTYKNEEQDILRIYNGHHYSLGGITKIKMEIIKKMNGFPNHIWGWGTEDEALFSRAKILDIKMSDKSIYKIKDTKNFTFLKGGNSGSGRNNVPKIWHWSVVKNFTDEKKNDLLTKNGLNDITYKIIEEVEINDYIKKIIVDL